MNALALQIDPDGASPASRRPDTPAIEPLIDKFTVADRLGVHFSTVERLIKADGLPVYRIGPVVNRQQLRFRWSEVEAWLAGRREGDSVRGGAR